MKNRILAAMLAFSLMALKAPFALHAQTWSTVLDYQFISGASSGGNCLAADAFGHVYSGGVGYPASGFGSGLTLQTDTTENDWLLSDDSNGAAPQAGSEVNGLVFASDGNLYSSGTLYYPCTQTSCPGSYWYIRMSSDYGASWTPVSLFQYTPGKSCGAGHMAADLSGSIYVVGTAPDAAGVGHWLVRKGSQSGQSWSSVDDLSSARAYGIGFVPNRGVFASGQLTTSTTTKTKITTTTSWIVRRSTDGGVTWSTVDSVQPPAGYNAHSSAVAGDADGNVYAIGSTTILVTSGRTTTAVSEWLVRKSSDGGNTWSTLDSFSYAAGKSSVALGIGTDSAGNPVVAGTGTDSLGGRHWLIRRPFNGNWQTVDDYQLAPGQNLAGACGVVSDAAGNLLVTGAANDAGGVMHWIVRRTNP